LSRKKFLPRPCRARRYNFFSPFPPPPERLELLAPVPFDPFLLWSCRNGQTIMSMTLRREGVRISPLFLSEYLLSLIWEWRLDVLPLPSFHSKRIMPSPHLKPCFLLLSCSLPFRINVRRQDHVRTCPRFFSPLSF